MDHLKPLHLKSFIFRIAPVFLLASGLPALAATLNVPQDYSSIQAAINAAASGDTILVDTGTYRENLVMRTNVTVRGVEAARTFIEARNSSAPVVTIDGKNNVSLRNFTLTNSADGVAITNSTSVFVLNNVFNALRGNAVSVDATSGAEIRNNVFYRNATAVDRATAIPAVSNNIFYENVKTISSGVSTDTNVTFNCFYRNQDLINGGIDSARGTDFQIGNALFVGVSVRDFHLKQSSACIDAGAGTDVIDNTVADMGAYGGQFADVNPYPVAQPTATNTSTANPEVFNIQVSWARNLAYLVTSTVLPGSYRLYYQLNQPGPPYNGTDAGNGTEPSPINVGDATSYTLTDLQPSTSLPGTPTLLSTTPRNQSIILDWSTATNANKYRIYYGINDVNENSLDVGNSTTATVSGLVNDTLYQFAVSASNQATYYLSVTAVDSTQAMHESDYSTATAMQVGAAIEGTQSNILTAMPSLVDPVPNLADDGCFVATAAFGADWVAEVRLLRDFRDRYLLTNGPGRAFVAWYYRNGPQAAQYLKQHAVFKPLVRAALMPFVIVAAFMLGSSLLTKAAITLLSLALVYRLVRRRYSGLSSAITGRPA